jgi:NADH-quinone oxidoreductase subunit G
VHNATTDRADILLSCSTYAEKQGTLVNFHGRVQRIRPAVATVDQDRALDGFAMSRWDKFASQNDRWGRFNKRDARPSWRILASLAATLGAKLKYSSAEDVFREIAERVPVFRGLSYDKIGLRGVALDVAPLLSEPLPQTSHV